MKRVLLTQESSFYSLGEVAFEWGLRMNGFGHYKKKVEDLEIAVR